MLESPGGSKGWNHLLKINVFDSLWVYRCPYHDGNKKLLTQKVERDSRLCSPSMDARVATTGVPSDRRTLFLEDH